MPPITGVRFSMFDVHFSKQLSAYERKPCPYSVAEWCCSIVYYLMHQLTFTFHLDETSLKSYLEKATRKIISLVITDNSTSMLSIREKNDSILIRLHRIFLAAGREVLKELSDYIRGRKRKTPLIRDFIKSNTHQIRKKPPRKISIQTEGSHYDLMDIYHSINSTYFDDRVSADITWGYRSPKRAARRRTLGSYTGQNHMIRINPILDSKNVPHYFLEYIVYHEMLHADIGIERDRGRRIIHSREFKKREKMFKYYARAVNWEKKRW
ncbi:MAG: SprT-like domain-containing protein [Nitrospirota bacterium]